MTPARSAKKISDSTGSPDVGEPVFLAVGKLRRPHATRGEMLMEILTDFPERIQVGKTIFAGKDHLPLRISSLRNIEGGGLIAFEGFDDSEAVGALRNTVLYVKSTDVPMLPEGEYYYHQIIGLSVISEDGTPVGELIEILETGANDVYIVRRENGEELLLPDIESVILKIDTQTRTITVRPPEWY